jgi:hypothetical protein
MGHERFYKLEELSFFGSLRLVFTGKRQKVAEATFASD